MRGGVGPGRPPIARLPQIALPPAMTLRSAAAPRRCLRPVLDHLDEQPECKEGPADGFEDYGVSPSCPGRFFDDCEAGACALVATCPHNRSNM